jgi:cytoskeletal protein CcmA (bactofilin family)
MFGRTRTKLRPLPEASLQGVGTFIGQGMEWQGDVVAAEDVVVFGILVGNIESTCQVRVERSGRVRGSISAARVVIEGAVDGDVEAARRIDVQATGRVKGNVAARHVSLADGARVGGEVQSANGAGGADVPGPPGPR